MYVLRYFMSFAMTNCSKEMDKYDDDDDDEGNLSREMCEDNGLVAC